MPKQPPKSRPVKLKAAGYGVSTETGDDRFFVVLTDGSEKRPTEWTFDVSAQDAVRIGATLDQYLAWRNEPK